MTVDDNIIYEGAEEGSPEERAYDYELKKHKIKHNKKRNTMI